jgi:hypothetical protein
MKKVKSKKNHWETSKIHLHQAEVDEYLKQKEIKIKKYKKNLIKLGLINKQGNIDIELLSTLLE